MKSGIQRPRPRTGATLIELLLVLLLVLLLAAAALPGYQEHLRRGKRAEARIALLQAAHWLERRATESGGYPEQLPERLAATPTGSYLVGYRNTGAQDRGYTLTAQPQGRQRLDRCGALTLAHTGLRALAASDAPAALVAECWNR